MKISVQSAEGMQAFALQYIESLRPGERATVVALSGELGAGKTTFSQGVARALGVTEAIQSPTFVIMKIYDLQGQNFDRLIHIDAYRLESPSEFLHLGWKELTADPKNLILIEWPEKVAEVLPKRRTITLKHVSETEREIATD